jgi:hypothetical protein
MKAILSILLIALCASYASAQLTIDGITFPLNLTNIIPTNGKNRIIIR